MNIIHGNEFVWKNNPNIFLLEGAHPSYEEGYSTVHEKVIGTNNLRNVAVLEKIIQISRSVVHINVPGIGLGTGFMISPDVMITNNHIFRSRNDAREAIIRFNYQIDLSGNFLPTDDYECDISFFHTNEPLDYSIVKVKGEPGLKWGYMQLPLDNTVEIDDDAFIIQHPNGGPKQIGLSDNIVKYVDTTVIQYLTDTLPGSSGSPVLDDSMRIIALHHSGGWIPEPSTPGSNYFRNEGINISAIVNDMPNLE